MHGLGGGSCKWLAAKAFWPAVQHFWGSLEGTKSTQVRLRARQLPCIFCPALADMLHPAMSRRCRAWAIDNRDPSSPRPRSGLRKVCASGCPGMSVSWR